MRQTVRLAAGVTVFSQNRTKCVSSRPNLLGKAPWDMFLNHLWITPLLCCAAMQASLERKSSRGKLMLGPYHLSDPGGIQSSTRTMKLVDMQGDACLKLS